MIIYIENLKELAKILLKLRSDCIKFLEHRVNAQTSIAYLYTSNEQVEFESQNIYISTFQKWNT